MEVLSHPEELTRDSIETWLEPFLKTLKRETSRDDLDRLILSIERMDFDDEDDAGWKHVIFEEKKEEFFGVIYRLKKERDDKEKLTAGYKFKASLLQTELLRSYQKSLPQKTSELRIERSMLKEEKKGRWYVQCDGYKESERKFISAGGEAFVQKATINNLDVAVRVQIFDPLLFSDKCGRINFKIHLSKGQSIILDRKNSIIIEYRLLNCRQRR